MEQEQEQPKPQERRSRLRRIYQSRLFLIAITAMLFAAGMAAFILTLTPPHKSSTPAGGGAGPAVVETAPAVPRTATIITVQNASVVPTPDAPITPNIAGWIRSIPIKQGGRVKAGEVVAIVQIADNATQQATADYQSATENLSSAQASYNDILNALQTGELSAGNQKSKLFQAKSSLADAKSAEAQAKAALNTANQALQQANADLQQSQSLNKQGALSNQELQQAENAQASAATRQNQVKITLESAQSDVQSASKQVISQEQALTHAQVRVSSLRLRLTTAQNIISAQQNALTKAQADLNKARSSQKLMPLQSPVQGEVASVSVSNGDLVTPGMEVVRIKPTGVSVVAFDVTDGETEKLKAGMPVIVAVPKTKKSLAGRISAIPPTVDGGAKRNRVLIKVNDPANQLKPGTQVPVQIPVGKVKAVAVPQEAVEQTGKGPQVWTIKDGNAEPQRVSIVRTVSDMAVVSKGLQPGDEVVVHTNRPLEQGTPVKIETRK